MKECSRCHTRKKLSDFYQRKIGPRAGEYYEKCKVCLRERGRSYYKLNRTRQLELALKRKKSLHKRNRKFITKYKDKPCVDCGQKYPSYVMDFDHKNPKEKSGNIAHLVSQGWSIGKLKEELVKCDIVCANCHRIRTHNNLPS